MARSGRNLLQIARFMDTQQTAVCQWTADLLITNCRLQWCIKQYLLLASCLIYARAFVP